jgi:hypothetical protein
MTDVPHATVISDPYRTPVTAHKRLDGGVVLSRGARFIALSDNEFRRLTDFVEDRAHISLPHGLLREL